MTCCAQDMQFLGYACRFKDAERLSERSWVDLTATISKEKFGPYEGEGVILNADSVETTTEPKDPVINFA